MAVALKTRERIVLESLALFNAQGERAITTNHIAAHLGISPGNLYYHFRNKQAIIAELFAQYERQVAQFLQRPVGRALTVADKTYYLEALLAAMWHYRFLHRDLEHLLDSDSELAARYTFSATKPRYFHVMDSSRKGPLGHNPAYMIHHGNVAYGPYDFENDPPFKRNRYLEYSLWNTVYDPDQRYAGGTFAMGSDGSDTLAQWVEDDQSLHNADIVSWFTAGFHHIPRVEDWPVMSTEWKTIHLMPMNFFAMNPAATIRLPADDPAALPAAGAAPAETPPAAAIDAAPPAPKPAQ